MVPAPHSSHAPHAFLRLERGAPATLAAQLVEQLRRAVLEGVLQPDHLLPSSRELARELGVSRNTVAAAYEALAADGTVLVRARRAPVVAHVPVRAGGQSAARAQPAAALPRLSRSARRLAAVVPPDRLDALLGGRPRSRPFGVGLPDLDLLPWRIFERCLARRLRAMSAEGALHHDPRGALLLRRAVLHHVAVARGVRATVDQVFITEGSQGALDLCCRALLDPGDAAWVEASGPLALRAAVRMAGARPIAIPVDDEGLRVHVGARRAPRARVAFVSPASAFPSGARLTLPRRIELLSWAGGAGAVVVEIDYEGELRFDGSPLPSLLGLDVEGVNDRVIHVGSFSRSLFPGLRLGFMIVPPALVRAVAQVRAASTRSPPYLLQAALADFIDEGHFARHLRKLKQATRRRRDFLLAELGRALPAAVRVRAPAGGSVLTLDLPEGSDDVAIVKALAARGVDAMPLSRGAAGRARASRAPGLILGFGAHAEPALAEAARTLAAVVGEAIGAGGRR
ncbi:PLP-dependent aminotransferase family protein [Sorangium sp. So ce394]|uniref:MocR-like pyridoxine biosynthesis transcription factor PdxR n=1 Tax=Sorangium sp. So ce394 TaxID=3133310 RepID=UPI003F5B46EB